MDKLGSGIHPKFSECRHREGTLRITCADQATKDWLGGLTSQEEPWEGAKLRFVEAKNLPKPVRTMVWVPGPVLEPEKIISRIAVQNEGICTESWRVVDRKEDSKGQQLVVLMDQTSWDTLGKVDHRPYLNFSRVAFKVLSKAKADEGATGGEKMEEGEGPSEEPPTKSSDDLP